MQKALELNGKKFMGQDLKLDKARSKETSQEGKKGKPFYFQCIPRLANVLRHEVVTINITFLFSPQRRMHVLCLLKTFPILQRLMTSRKYLKMLLTSGYL